MAPAAFGGLEVGEGPCERREGSGQPLGIRLLGERSEIVEVTQDLAPVNLEERGDGNILQVADGLCSQLRGNPASLHGRPGWKSVE